MAASGRDWEQIDSTLSQVRSLKHVGFIIRECRCTRPADNEKLAHPPKGLNRPEAKFILETLQTLRSNGVLRWRVRDGRESGAQFAHTLHPTISLLIVLDVGEFPL